MIARTAVRPLRVLGLAALVAPALVALSSGTAQAAQSISSPADGTVYTSGQTVTVSGSFSGCTGTLGSNCPTGTLSVTDPSGTLVKSAQKKASGTGSQSISLQVTLSGSNRNGGYEVTLAAGGSSSKSHFYTNIAPATPSGFSASTTSGDPHDVLLTWSRGTEPDLQSYTVFDGSGTVIQDGISAASACSGSSCSYSLYYDNPTPGTYSYSYALSATRAGGCSSGSCPGVESSRTANESASLTTPQPPPSPTPQPSAGGTGSGGTSTGGGNGSGSASGGSGSGSGSGGGSASGSSTGSTTPTSPIPLPTLNPGVAARALALNFSSFSPGLGIPKLPPLPKTDVVLPGGEQPIPQGTYNPQLPYKEGSETVRSRTLASDPIGYVTSVDWKKVATPLAWALILVLSAAHLRRWIGAHVED